MSEGLRERKKVATRQALSWAALNLALERGLENVRVEDIAAAAGVSERTFRNYFSSKYEALTARHFDRMVEAAAALLDRPAAEPLWEAIEHVLAAIMGEQGERSTELLASLRAVLAEPALQAEMIKATFAAENAFAKAVATRTGTDAGRDLYPQLVASAVGAAQHVATERWLHADPPIPLWPELRQALCLLAAGLPEPRGNHMNGIYHESRGSGPVLLFIPGGNGDAGPYSHVAHHLADRFTTVTYDRRGFSRSPIEGEPDDAKRLDADVEDALGLLNEHTDQPAYVFGSSSGAIVALHLFAKHPDRVKTVVAHEPPLAPLLPDGDKWLAVFQDIHDLYQAEGLAPAMRKFVAAMGMTQRQAPDPAAEVPQAVKEMMARMSANMHFWARHELLVYPSLVPDLATLDALKDRIVLAGGQESKEYMPYQPNVVLAERFGSEVLDFPGDHIGYAPPNAAEFAERLAGVLARD